MKIIQLISSLADGGAENLVKEYSIKLTKLGNDVIVVTSDKRNYGNIYSALVNNNINIVVLSGGKVMMLMQWLNLLFKYRPDVIHGHLKVTKLMCFSPVKTKLVYTFHTDLPRILPLWGKGFKYEIEYLLKNRKLDIILLNKKMKDDAQKFFNTDKTRILENCINFDRYRNVSIERDVLLKRLNIPSDSFIIGHIGRFVDVKNHERLISIFEKVSKEKKNSHLLLIGEGERKDYIKKLVKEKSLKNVHFLGIRNDIPELLNTMDVFVLTSKTEGFPITVIESQVVGVRTIVSKAVPEEAVRMPSTLRLSLEADDECWVKAILGNKQNYNVRYNLDDCSVDNVVDKLIDIYRN